MTAVEWLIEQLKDVKYNTLEKNGYSIALERIHKQAKEMEKQQIIDAMDFTQRTDFYVKYEGSEQYYNETFKKK